MAKIFRLILIISPAATVSIPSPFLSESNSKSLYHEAYRIENNSRQICRGKISGANNPIGHSVRPDPGCMQSTFQDPFEPIVIKNRGPYRHIQDPLDRFNELFFGHVT
jgi:hypothetical protein